MFPDATRYTAFLNRLNRIHGQLGALLSFTGTASSIRDQTISLSSDVVVITNSFMNHKPLIMLLFIKCNMFLQLGAVTTGFVHSECTARQKPPVGKRERVFHGFCIVDPQHEGKAIYSPLNYA